ncbi:hypothetical protein DFH94DRAFT_781267 [Russula ochroleuca]|uniref:Uncharacterized protein n=1 Tax=Russula ochroleuca TaxID=152965 RepID=A0A9P5JV29_9AGAM|nr:hypothetical protein DFH94DRAFT_781267 [Russula ochroleuca]
MLYSRYKNREHLEDVWASTIEAILKFVRQLTSILATQFDAPTITPRPFPLAAQLPTNMASRISRTTGMLRHFIFVRRVFPSPAQLQAIMLVTNREGGCRGVAWGDVPSESRRIEIKS